MLRLFLYVMVLALVSNSARAEESLLRETYQGAMLVSLAPAVGEQYDVPLLDGEEGLLRMKQALYLIIKQSPFNAVHLKTLIEQGPVYLIYDPGFPETRAHTGLFGIFQGALPELLAGENRNKKKYVMTIGRHAIRWPVKELAGILVHELVGHGTQYAKNRFGVIPRLDMECEAWLYHEKSHQDFKIDKRSSFMVRFRQNLEQKNCAGFIRYLKREKPAAAKLWNTLNPDVPKLLEVFEEYIK